MTRIHCLLLPLATLLLCVPGPAQEPEPPPEKERRTIEVASLGAATRAPTRAEVDELDLKVEVRARGQIVTEVEEDGAAARAGLAVGDALVWLGKVELFSRDDVDDLLRTGAPGDELAAVVVRAGGGEEETVRIALGADEVAAPESRRLAWQYASLANLEAALERAKKEDRLVLVGLSGAET